MRNISLLQHEHWAHTHYEQLLLQPPLVFVVGLRVKVSCEGRNVVDTFRTFVFLLPRPLPSPGGVLHIIYWRGDTQNVYNLRVITWSSGMILHDLIFSPSRHLSNDCCHLRLFLVLRSTALRWEREDTDHRTVTSQLSYNLNKSRTQFISAELPNCLVTNPTPGQERGGWEFKGFWFYFHFMFLLEWVRMKRV